MAARHRKVAGQRPQQLVEIAGEGRVEVHLNAQILINRHTGRRSDTASNRADQVGVDIADGRVSVDIDADQMRRQFVEPGAVFGQPRSVDEVFLKEYGGQRREAPGIGSGTNRQVVVSEFCGFAAARVDDDHRAVGIAGDLFERPSGLRDAVRLIGVLADPHRHLGVFEIAPGVVADYPAIHPELTEFFLTESVRLVFAAQHCSGCR